MWLIAWRSRLYSICLILIILNSHLMIMNPVQVLQSEPNIIYLLEGWAISQAIEHRKGPVSWSSQACELSFTEIKILTICSWLTVAAWALFAFYLSVDLLPNSGPTWKWLALLFSSHMLVAGLRRERTYWLALLHQQANKVIEVQTRMQLANFEYIQQAFSLAEGAEGAEATEAQNQSPTTQKLESASVSSQDESAKPTVVLQKQQAECSDLPQKSATSCQEVKKSIKNNQPPSPASQEMVNQLAKLVIDLPIGTNLGMFHFLWMMVTGQLLASRGAIFPALQAVGLEKEAVRRAWAAFSTKSWRIETLLALWQDQVITKNEWQERSYQGYRPKAVDLTAFWRPTVANCQTKHYDPRAGKAMPAVVLGVMARVGDINGQRVPLPELFVRADQDNPSEKQLERKLIQRLKDIQSDDEIHIFDAGFDLSMLIELALKGFVLRLPVNFVGRRNQVKEYCGRGTRPKYGHEVRPLGRQSKTRWIEADPADETVTILDGEVQIKVELWKDLVQRSDKPGAKSFNVMAFHDPRYKDPWLLATDVKELTPQTVRSLYKDRWPVEQLPLAAKQMLGSHRQFVWSEENMQRLPELSLLAGSILTHVAATLPPIPTGFWDRAPKATPGRLRRYLNLQSLDSILSKLPLPARIRKKESRTGHLKTGHSARKEALGASTTT